MASSLIPELMIDLLEISQRGYDSSVGPGYGGLVRFNSPLKIPENGSYTRTTSIANAGFTIEQPVGDFFAVNASRNRVLYNFTVQPLTDLILGSNEYTQNINCDDFNYTLKPLWLPTENQSLSLDFIWYV